MTKKDIDDIISIVCPNDEDFEKPIISPKYLKQELEQIALEQQIAISCNNCQNFKSEDNYCKLLQINWLPDNFGCTKGQLKL